MIRRLVRLLGALTGWALLAAAGVVAGARLAGDDRGPLPFVVPAAPYAVVPAAVGLLLALAVRARLRVLVGLVVTGVLLATQAPLAVADGATATGSGVTVMTVNLQFGGGDLAEVLEAVERERVDVLSVQELTPAAATRLTAGLRRRLPHHYLAPAPRATGTGLWSRLPLQGTRTLPGLSFRNLVAQVDVAGARLTVAAVHPVPPMPGRTTRWRAEHAALRAELGRLRGAVVVAGDLNATLDHAAMRRLGDDGFVSAQDGAGAGLVRTWPMDGPGSGPLAWRAGVPVLGIDHVLVRGPWRAVRVATVAVPGSDHAAVVAELRPAA